MCCYGYQPWTLHINGTFGRQTVVGHSPKPFRRPRYETICRLRYVSRTYTSSSTVTRAFYDQLPAIFFLGVVHAYFYMCQWATTLNSWLQFFLRVNVKKEVGCTRKQLNTCQGPGLTIQRVFSWFFCRVCGFEKCFSCWYYIHHLTKPTLTTRLIMGMNLI